MTWSIVCRYAGQQKFFTSSVAPVPPPPPEDNPPNGIGAAAVSALAAPSFASAPAVGVRLLDRSAGVSTGFVRGLGRVFDPGSGTVISGVFATGAAAGFGRAS